MGQYLYKNVAMVFFVYDCTDEGSFLALETWLETRQRRMLAAWV